MPFWTYIIQSELTGRLYVGQTEHLDSRLERHNSNEPGSRRYTHRQKGPWRLIYSEEHTTRSDTMRRERFFKSGQGREWIRENLTDR
ncbi:MAG: GIY-YIG nuclease family protein [Desulfobacteria bacterium]